MADRSLKHLNYGHPGDATYDIESEAWTFLKKNTSRQFKQVQTRQHSQLSGTCSKPPSIHFLTPQVSTNRTNLQDEATKLTRRHPQLTPATPSSAELALVSVALLNTTPTYDPRIGSLLSFGSITFGGLWDTARRVAAVASGETGNILQLAILTKERHAWDGVDRSVWVEGSSLKEADCGYWNEEAAPIQQICFSQSEDRSSLLAVRLPTRTVILRPIYYRRPQAAKPSPFHHLPPSTIDAHPILSVRMDQTGESAHVDVVFNPDFQYQFGIVNQNHTWSVWEIEKKHRVDVYTVSCTVKGHINSSEDVDLNREDSWAKMLWVRDLYTLLVCNRRHLSIVSIRGNGPIYFPCPSLFKENSADWILDVKHHPKYKDHVLVLTSTHLILMKIVSSGEHPDTTDAETVTSILVSWRHYRGSEDFTLQFSVQMLTDEESCVLLYSRLNFLVEVYTFKEHSSSSAKLMSCSDPSMINLQLSGPAHINQLQLDSMQFGFQGRSRTPGPGRTYPEKGLMFYRLFITRSNLSVHEMVFYTHEHGANVASGLDCVVEDFERSLIRHRRQHVSRKESIKEEEDFIVPNGIIVVAGIKSNNALRKPGKGRERGQALSQRPPDYRLLYYALIQKESSEERATESVDIETVSNQLHQMFVEASDTDSLPLGTFMEFAGRKLRLSDIDEASSMFQQLLRSEHQHSMASVRQIASAHVLDVAGDQEPTITSLYDDILRHWVAPLPPSTPIRVRQNREQLARRIAAEVMLASHRIRHVELQEPSIEQQHGSSQETGHALPILALRSPIVEEMSSQEWNSSPPPPTPSHSSVPPSSQPSLRSVTPSSITHFGDPLVRLSDHLQLKEHSLTPTIIPGSVNQLLRHWQLGTDPHMYNWSANERTLRSESRDADTQASSEREQRRKERRERRQQRENKIMRSKSLSQTSIGIPTRSQSLGQPPMAVPASSPGPALGRMGSSSQAPSRAPSQASGSQALVKLDSVAPMSQIEPGRFGGRLGKKKRKKGRVSGF